VQSELEHRDRSARHAAQRDQRERPAGIGNAAMPGALPPNP